MAIGWGTDREQMSVIFPSRKRNRLSGFSYSASGAYFVTVCVSPRRNVFWCSDDTAAFREEDPLENVGADIIRPFAPPPLTEAGKTVEQAIRAIPDHYDGVDVECFCIMPDHVHMLLVYAADENGRIISAPTLSVVVGSMKRYVTRKLGRHIWQKSFYDHVIRNEKGFHAACRYIAENPARWREDHENAGMTFDEDV